MLTVVATLGVLLVLVQGTLYYRAKGSARFLGSEKTKVLAQQLAEAGVEENIADLGNRRLRIHSGMHDSVTYDGKAFGDGSYTTRISTVALGAESDTVELVSTGTVGRGAQTVQARMKLKKVMDTTRTPLVIVEPETTKTLVSHTEVVDSTESEKDFDPSTLPDVQQQPAYAACMASSNKKCDVCHLPPGNPSNVHVISISKNAIGTHFSHHGDYISTDGTCDLYESKVTTKTYIYGTVVDTLKTITDHTTYDTSVVIDTVVKVQILSWR